MQTMRNVQFQTVIDQVKDWPVDDRLALAQEILRTLRSEWGESDLQKETLDVALGLLATDQPAPTDEKIQQWIRERRMEKYG